jgi:uncharacterized protein
VRVVVDTNVVVAGIFWAGKPASVLAHWATGRFALCVSAGILGEYFEVIERLAGRCGRDGLAQRWKAYLFEHVELVEVTWLYDRCRDPDDAMFVECAVSAGATYLVSGDDDLLTLGQIEGVSIVTPAGFLAVLDR